MFCRLDFNFDSVLILIFFIDLIKSVVKAGFEFTDEEYKPEYDDLENPVTTRFIAKVTQGVSCVQRMTTSHEMHR